MPTNACFACCCGLQGLLGRGEGASQLGAALASLSTSLSGCCRIQEVCRAGCRDSSRTWAHLRVDLPPSWPPQGGWNGFRMGQQ